MKINEIHDQFDLFANALKENPSRMEELRKVKNYILELQDKLSRRNMQIKELKKKLDKVEEILISDNTQDDKNEALEVVLNINIPV